MASAPPPARPLEPPRPPCLSTAVAWVPVHGSAQTGTLRIMLDPGIARPHLSGSLPLPPENIMKKVRRGLPTTLMVTAALVDGQENLISMLRKSCKITFHVWDEVYQVELSSQPPRTKAVVSKPEAAVRRCLKLDAEAMDAASNTHPVRLVVRVDVNQSFYQPGQKSALRRWLEDSPPPDPAHAVSPGGTSEHWEVWRSDLLHNCTEALDAHDAATP